MRRYKISNLLKQASICFLLIVSLTSCLNPTPPTLVRKSDTKYVISNKIVVLPSSLTVKEIFPGGITEMIAHWTFAARKNVQDESANLLKEKYHTQVETISRLRISQSIADHIKLFKEVSYDVKKHTHGLDTWQHKIDNFDYGLGQGLSHLTDNNFQAAIFIHGIQYVSKFRVDTQYGNINNYPANLLNIGKLTLSFALVDLKSGNILWFEQLEFSSIDLRDKDKTRAMISQVFSKMPKEF